MVTVWGASFGGGIGFGAAGRFAVPFEIRFDIRSGLLLIGVLS
jgi:hypothetical protein